MMVVSIIVGGTIYQKVKGHRKFIVCFSLLIESLKGLFCIIWPIINRVDYSIHHCFFMKVRNVVQMKDRAMYHWILADL